MSHCCLDLMTSGIQFPMNRTVARKWQRNASLKSSVNIAQPPEVGISEYELHTVSNHRAARHSGDAARYSCPVLCVCCWELSPFWDCDNCHLTGQQRLYGGSVVVLKNRQLFVCEPQEKVTVFALFKMRWNFRRYQSVWNKSKMKRKPPLKSVTKLGETNVSLRVLN